MIRKLAEQLWTVEVPGRAYGVEMGERCNLLELDGGGLLVHVPVPLDSALGRAVDQLGSVRVLCAPNLRCCDHLSRWRQAYPDARLLVAPGTAQQLPQLRDATELGADAKATIGSDLDQHLFEGIPTLNEVALLHRPSRTLLLADLACTVPQHASLAVRAYLRLSLGGLRFGPTRDLRWLVADRQAASRSLERLLSWDFDRVAVRRGALLERGGAAALRKAYRWLGREPRWWQ